MKSYTITVNGNVYDVTVEENGSVATPASAPRRAVAPVPVAAPVAAPKAAGAGSIKVEAGAAGKVFKVEASVGQAVKKGDAVVIIEAMKMQSEYKVKNKCVIKSILTSEGETINADQTLITLETYTEE